MLTYKEMTKDQLAALKTQLEIEYGELKSKNLKLDMSRGKPSSKQLDLSVAMLSQLATHSDIITQNGIDTGNYGVLEGIDEAREMMGYILDLPAENVFVGGNSSLNLMHDCISFAYFHGLPQSEKPWKDQQVKFLCPVPGYDRHFAISEHFGAELVMIDMDSNGPNMDQVEEYIKDPAVKGMWCIPKYSNPSGITYSDDVVKRMALLNPAAPDFRIFWDNAYSVHHLDKNQPDKLLNFMAELEKTGKEDMVMMFCSTSKITFPGSGISAVGASSANLKWLKQHMALQTISYDKLNQLRHVRFLPNKEALSKHMEKQAEMLKPKFDIVIKNLNRLSGLDIAFWDEPKGGYFICLKVMDSCAKRVVELCKEAGVVMTPAGATHPYGKDPRDNTIRIAPTYPPVEELEEAANLLCLCVKLASVEKCLKG